MFHFHTEALFTETLGALKICIEISGCFGIFLASCIRETKIIVLLPVGRSQMKLIAWGDTPPNGLWRSLLLQQNGFPQLLEQAWVMDRIKHQSSSTWISLHSGCRSSPESWCRWEADRNQDKRFPLILDLRLCKVHSGNRGLKIRLEQALPQIKI